MTPPLSNAETQIMVQVLDKQYDLSEFTLDLVPDFMQDVQVGGILDPLGQLIQWLWSMIEPAIEWVVNTLKPLFDIVKNAVISGLTAVVNFGTDLLKGLVNGVKVVVDGIVGAVGNVWTFLQGVWTWLNSMWQSLSAVLASLGASITSFFSATWKAFTDLGNWIASLVAEGVKGFQNLWAGVQKFFTDAYNNLVTGFNSVVLTLQGGINALGNIWNWLTNLPKMLWDAAVGVFDTIVGALTTLGNVVWTGITTVASWIWGGLQALGQIVWSTLTTIGSFLLNIVTGAISGIIDVGKSVVSAIFTPISNVISSAMTATGEAASEFMKGLIDRVMAGKSKGELAELTLFAINIFTNELSLYLLSFGVASVGAFLKEYNVETGIELAPLHIGIAGKVAVKVALGDVLDRLANLIEKLPDTIATSMISGYGFYLGRAYSRAFLVPVRNTLTLELPPVPTLIDITRRNMPTGQLKTFTDGMVSRLQLYGYSDEVIRWQTTTAKDWNVTIEDRFSKSRQLPVSLLYDLPTGSEFSRMMVRDIFGPPTEPLPSFTKAMAMRGFNEDTALMYYLLHFRYPPMEILYQFISRVSAGYAWIDIKPTPEGSLGFTGSSPKALSVAYGKTPIESLKKLAEKIQIYGKWHDYAPFSWISDFTADKLIMMDMMADIPTRIDARWMYKWGIILDDDLMRITLAKGMHPDWVQLVTVGEAMNALTEERSIARTGVLSTFKDGFNTESIIRSTLSKLSTVTILGKKFDVKFLAGEIDLVTIRAKYDRALDILRDYSRDLLRAFTDNVLEWSDVIGSLSDSTKLASDGLGIKLELDKQYFDLYEPSAAILKNVRTVGRVRSWIRYMMWRILTRMAGGYMSEEEFSSFINAIVLKGKLAPEERDILVEVGSLMFNFTKRQAIVGAVLKKLSKGLIKKEDALKELLANGLDEETAEAMIEDQAKTYVLSISTLLSYADDVQISEELLSEKIESMGVPEDEIPIILEVFRVRPIKTEVAQIIRSTLDDFEEGYLVEKDLRTRLETLGKKPTEIELLVQYGAMEKEAKTKRLLVDAAINRLKRGVSTLAQCKKELEAIIVDPILVEALIEKNARFYEVSIAKLQEMAEVIPVSNELLLKKMDMIGVPADEQALYLPFIKVKEIEEELKAYFTQVGTDYVNGDIDKATFVAELNNIATLWGTAKNTLGVDWVLYSPDERKLLTLVYDRKRARKVKK